MCVCLGLFRCGPTACNLAERCSVENWALGKKGSIGQNGEINCSTCLYQEYRPKLDEYNNFNIWIPLWSIHSCRASEFIPSPLLPELVYRLFLQALLPPSCVAAATFSLSDSISGVRRSPDRRRISRRAARRALTPLSPRRFALLQSSWQREKRSRQHLKKICKA